MLLPPVLGQIFHQNHHFTLMGELNGIIGQVKQHLAQALGCLAGLYEVRLDGAVVDRHPEAKRLGDRLRQAAERLQDDPLREHARQVR